MLVMSTNSTGKLYMMQTLRIGSYKIPKCIRIFHMCLRISSLRLSHGRKLKHIIHKITGENCMNFIPALDFELRILVKCYREDPKYLVQTNITIWSMKHEYMPSSVYILTAKPRASRTVSGKVFPSPERVKYLLYIHLFYINLQPIEKRTRTRVLVPFLNTLALQISEISWFASNVPKAPPLDKDDNQKRFSFWIVNAV